MTRQVMRYFKENKRFPHLQIGDLRETKRPQLKKGLI